jgi:hypothetical protein
MLDRLNEISTSSEGIVNLGELDWRNRIGWVQTYDDRNAMFVRNFCDGLKVRDVVFGVSNALDINSLCFLVNHLSEILRLVSVHKLGVDAQSREENLELVIGSAVQVSGRYNVVTSMC